MESMEALRDRILLATLPNVAFDGWTMQAMRMGAQMAGLDNATVMRAFPDGVPELVEHFNDWADRQMIAALSAQDLASMRVRERVKAAMRARLEALAPHQEAVRRLVSWAALPNNAPLAARLLYRTVDAIWNAVGDTATDYNYYTKRALLAGVQSATILYWLNDTSEDFRDTWSFLDRRIDDVMRVGRMAGSLGNLTGVGRVLELFPSPIRFARQFRRRMDEV